MAPLRFLLVGSWSSRNDAWVQHVVGIMWCVVSFRKGSLFVRSVVTERASVLEKLPVQAKFLKGLNVVPGYISLKQGFSKELQSWSVTLREIGIHAKVSSVQPVRIYGFGLSETPKKKPARWLVCVFTRKWRVFCSFYQTQKQPPAHTLFFFFSHVPKAFFSYTFLVLGLLVQYCPYLLSFLKSLQNIDSSQIPQTKKKKTHTKRHDTYTRRSTTTVAHFSIFTKNQIRYYTLSFHVSASASLSSTTYIANGCMANAGDTKNVRKDCGCGC